MFDTLNSDIRDYAAVLPAQLKKILETSLPIQTLNNPLFQSSPSQGSRLRVITFFKNSRHRRPGQHSPGNGAPEEKFSRHAHIDSGQRYDSNVSTHMLVQNDNFVEETKK
jgi:hypothetical protein